MQFNYNDGGRSKYFKASNVRDCVTRAIAIASGKDYKEVYDMLACANAKSKVGSRGGKYRTTNIGKRTASHGIFTKDYKPIIESLGGKWVSCMGIGTGCKVHMSKDELPNGRIICSLSKHLVAVIDGVVNDTFDCTRGGTRCVYGYWTF